MRILTSSMGARVAVLVGVVLLGGMSSSRPAHGQVGGVGAFSRIGFDAQGIALGNALVASTTADVSPYYNAALLSNASEQRITGSAALMAFDRELQSLGFTSPLGPTAGVGVRVLHAGVSDIDGRNADGRHTGTLSTDEFAVSVAYGNRFTERLSVGVGLTLYQSDIVPETSPVQGFGIEFGVAYRVTSRLTLAGAVHDLLAKYEWDTGAVGGTSQTDQFPVRVRLGGSYTVLDDRVQLLGEVESRFVGRDRVEGGRTRQEESVLLRRLRGRLGVEYRPFDIVSLRLGADRLGVNGTDGIRPGAGFSVRQQVGELGIRLSYGVALEPNVRTVMNMGTLELFLQE